MTRYISPKSSVTLNNRVGNFVKKVSQCDNFLVKEVGYEEYCSFHDIRSAVDCVVFILYYI